MNITVIGCGRWGSFHAWHANKIGHAVTLYGRKNSATMDRLERTGGNDYLTLSKEIRLTRDLSAAVNFADVIIISVGSQNLRDLLDEIKICGAPLDGKKFLLCMKGLERGTGKRLTTVFNEVIPAQNFSVNVAVWVGPGHVEDFVNEIPNCMVIASADENFSSADAITMQFGISLTKSSTWPGPTQTATFTGKFSS